MTLKAGANDGECGGRGISLHSQELEAETVPVPGQPGIHSKGFSEKNKIWFYFYVYSKFMLCVSKELDLLELASHAVMSHVIRCSKPNSGPLKKQQKLVKAKPSLSAPENFQ